jgi:hypothetical protein
MATEKMDDPPTARRGGKLGFPHVADVLRRLYWFALGAVLIAGFSGGVSITAENSHTPVTTVSEATLHATVVFLVLSVAAYVLLTSRRNRFWTVVLLAAASGLATFFAVVWGVAGAMVLGPRGPVDYTSIVVWAALPTALVSVLFALFVGACLRLLVVAARSVWDRRRRVAR